VICFQIEINDEKVCTAGIGEFGVLTATLAWVRNRDAANQNAQVTSGIALNVGGLTDSGSGQDEFVEWIRKRLSVGDEVKVTILENVHYDEPTERTQRDSAEQAEKAREYYEQIKQESETR
jgi:hypothetical protein